MSVRTQWLRDAWSFLATFVGKPGEFVVDTTNWRLVVHDGSTPGGYPTVSTTDLRAGVAMLGINTGADTTNRLAVKSEAALLSWDDAKPGPGNMRVSVNKKAASNDAAFLFQTGYSTRALFGTLASDDFALKVSPDGSTFYTPLVASAATGRMILGRIDAPLEVSANTGALPDPPAQSILRLSGADGSRAVLALDSYGAAEGGSLTFRAAGGTAAAPAALKAGALIGQVSAVGRGAKSFSAAARAWLSFLAAETWTDGAQGTRAVIAATPLGATAAADVLSVEANGSVGLVPLPSDPKGGAAGQIYVSGTDTAIKWHDGTGWKRITNFAKSVAYTNFDNYVGADAWTKVQFNNADSNDQGAFIASKNRFVAPEAGLYGFNVSLTYKRNGTSAPAAFEAQLYRNGTAAGRGRAAATGSLVDGITVVDLASALKLAANDYVEVYVRFTGADGYVAASDSFLGAQQMA
ncbi:hypothetical protein [Methylobacterium brachiatum]|uniref:hyaluronate lyase N-terminal domain-containing protein n=1 Tax=Methylobacterium brachiatum TaxID=269660 RepID=UPI00244A36AA|nr:hypothetical protein [Methylobacterium brachiatum]MDH2310331.1 hypothetical protein [Methylobacterium brachiatum]